MFDFSVELDKVSIPFLKRWTGLYRSADIGCLFRLRKDLGLQLTSFTFHFKHLQLVRCCLLKNSRDPVVAGAFTLKAARERSFSRTWSASQELEKLGLLVEHAANKVVKDLVSVVPILLSEIIVFF